MQGGGSGTGIAALLNDNADIAQAFRAMADEEWDQARERGMEVREVVVARDAVVVCVHPDNPVEVLSLEQLGAIYRGEMCDWSEVGGRPGEIVLLSRDTSSGTHVFFRDRVVRGDGEMPGAEYSDNAMFVPSTQFIVDEVAQNPAAIGYIGLGYLGDAVKAVNLLAGESGVPISVIDGHRDGLPYPLTRPLFFYLVGGREGAADDYIEFVLGNTGQEIVRELNFVPVGE